MWSFGDLLPQAYSPNSADYATVAIGAGVYANFKRGGSLRFTAQDGNALAAGCYSTTGNSEPFSYPTRRSTRPVPTNRRISPGLSDAVTGVTAFSNYQLANGNYYEYFDVDAYAGVIHVAVNENWMDFVDIPVVPTYRPNFGCNGTLFVNYYQVDASGSVLLGPTTIQPTLFNKSGGAEFGGCIQLEPNIRVNPANPDNIVVQFIDLLQPVSSASVGTFASFDRGATWMLVPFTDTVAPLTSAGVLPFDTGVNGDNSLAIDSFGNVVYAGLWEVSKSDNGLGEEALPWAALSQDGGLTPRALATLGHNHPGAVSCDYPVGAWGPDGANGTVTYVSYKLDKTLFDLLFFGTTFNVQMISYHAKGPGLFDAIVTRELPGTEPFGYGRHCVDAYGNLYAANNGMPVIVQTDDPDRAYDCPYADSYGTFLTGNAPISVSRCMQGWAGPCERPRVVARTNVGVINPPAQPSRGTWAQANIAIDRSSDRQYLAWMDLEDADPSVDGYVLSTTSAHIWIATSDDRGLTWSAPYRVDDFDGSFKFQPRLVVDPVTREVTVAWRDTRDATNPDPLSGTQTAVYYATMPATYFGR